jgi:hypothetical protein
LEVAARFRNLHVLTRTERESTLTHTEYVI